MLSLKPGSLVELAAGFQKEMPKMSSAYYRQGWTDKAGDRAQSYSGLFVDGDPVGVEELLT
jgi:hypothetical protein